MNKTIDLVIAIREAFSAGGMFFPEEFGFGYIRALAENFYGIKDCIIFKALGLDIDGADEEQILLECEKEIHNSI